MYFEQLSIAVKDHIRTHLADYIAVGNVGFEKPVKLVMPRSFTAASFVGGTIGLHRDTLPALAVNFDTKDQSPTDENLWSYMYSGALVGMVGANNGDDVERLAKRWEAMLERFVREHQVPPTPTDSPFLIVQLGFSRSQFFGAAQIPTKEGEQPLWVDGFVIEVACLLSEQGPGTHI